MRKNTARNAPVVLQSSDEWVEWYHNIKNVAIQQSVLDYCDPYKEPNEITSMPERAEPPEFRDQREKMNPFRSTLIELISFSQRENCIKRWIQTIRRSIKG